MNRFWVHLATGLTTMVGVSVIVSACAHDDSSFFLQDVLAPPTGAGTMGCIFTADPTQGLLSEGYLDVQAVSNFAKTYEAVFLAADQIIPQGNQALQLTETSRIEIQGAIVTITNAAGTVYGGTPYTTLGAGILNPANGNTPGYGAVEFTLVDPNTIDCLRDGSGVGCIDPPLGWLERRTIVTYTKAYGTTLGGDHVESNTFIYPIVVCKGCLIGFDTDLAQAPQPNCAGGQPSTSGGPSVCFFGQDAVIDCHSCYGDPFCRCGAAAETDPTCFAGLVTTDGGVDAGGGG